MPSTTTQCSRRYHHRLAGAVLAWGLGGAHDAHACQIASSSDQISNTVLTLDNTEQAGVLLAQFTMPTAELYLRNCPRVTVPLLIDMPLTGLAYVRDVQLGGARYPAYATSSTSPLLVFRHWMSSGTLTNLSVLRIGQINRNGGHAGGRTSSFLQVAVVSRGGWMHDIPETLLGVATSRPEGYSVPPRRHLVGVAVRFRHPTCRLYDQVLALPDLSANLLPTPGSVAGERPLRIRMECPVSGLPLRLRFQDANAPGSGQDRLAPARGTTAQGVRLQVVRDGRSLRSGEDWLHGATVAGEQHISLDARYHREAQALVPGDIRAEALLVAEYD